MRIVYILKVDLYMKNTFTNKYFIAMLLVTLIAITSVCFASCNKVEKEATSDSAPTSVSTVDETTLNVEITTLAVVETATTVVAASTTATETTIVDETTVNKTNNNQSSDKSEGTVVSEGNTSPQHTHSYGWVTKKATCTDDGYKVYSCACGAEYTSDYVDALGHDWNGWMTVKEATSESEGKRENTCNRCGKIKSESIDKIAGPYDASCHSDEDLLAERILYYINQYRSTSASQLPRMREYADYRAMQLADRFEHNKDDERYASTLLKYGEYVKTEESYYDWDTGEITYTGNILEYYSPKHTIEAIGKSTSCSGSIDDVAKRVADMYYNSSGHWNYVGSSNNLYVSVGIYFDGPNLFTCIIAGDEMAIDYE